MAAKTVGERFWTKVDRGPHPKGCWLWTSCRSGFGYGVIGKGGKTHRAHRVSYELCFGPIPDGMCVCHRCDVPACVNPEHLFLGTKADNNRDMANKGRHADFRGERHARSVLTNDDVVSIRSEYAAGGVTLVEIAARFGVVHTTILRAINRENWSHI